MLSHRVKRIHFIGIGGSGMCGIAEVLLTLGYEVSGSDIRLSDTTDRLARLGARVFKGHAAENVGEAQVVVYSSAVDQGNPEIIEGQRMGIPLIRRAEMLAELMRLKYSVAVAGTHGKTTTTSMAGVMLSEAGLDPTVVIGGRLNILGSHARLGEGDYMVAEADESDASFLVLSPVIAVITNIDDDHLDHYRSMERLRSAFIEFARKVPFYGSVVACGDDSGVRAIIPEIKRRVVTYGFSAGVSVRATDLSMKAEGSTAAVLVDGKMAGTISLAVPGRHNVENALAALTVGLELNVPFERASAGLAKYSGVARRLQLKGENRGIRVFDDYGHHPTEIRATLSAARVFTEGSGGKLWALFQPHRYSRTNLLHEEFGGVFASCDGVVITDIYAAGEKQIQGVSATMIVEAVLRFGKPHVEYVADLEGAAKRVAAWARSGDVVLTLGAGDVSRWGERILDFIAGAS